MKKLTKFLIINILFIMIFLPVSVNAAYTKKVEKTETITTNKLEAVMVQGSQFNSKIISLAGNASNIKNIVKSNVLNISPTNNNIVSETNSSFPVYVWYKNGTIYYYSKVNGIYFNANSSQMFKSLSNLETLDLSGFKLNRVTNANSIFDGTDFKELKTPKNYPSGVPITLPSTMYDSNLNPYTTLGSSPVNSTIKKHIQ